MQSDLSCESSVARRLGAVVAMVLLQLLVVAACMPLLLAAFSPNFSPMDVEESTADVVQDLNPLESHLGQYGPSGNPDGFRTAISDWGDDKSWQASSMMGRTPQLDPVFENLLSPSVPIKAPVDRNRAGMRQMRDAGGRWEDLQYTGEALPGQSNSVQDMARKKNYPRHSHERREPSMQSRQRTGNRKYTARTPAAPVSGVAHQPQLLPSTVPFWPNTTKGWVMPTSPFAYVPKFMPNVNRERGSRVSTGSIGGMDRESHFKQTEFNLAQVWTVDNEDSGSEALGRLQDDDTSFFQAKPHSHDEESLRLVKDELLTSAVARSPGFFKGINKKTLGKAAKKAAKKAAGKAAKSAVKAGAEYALKKYGSKRTIGGGNSISYFDPDFDQNQATGKRQADVGHNLRSSSLLPASVMKPILRKALSTLVEMPIVKHNRLVSPFIPFLGHYLEKFLDSDKFKKIFSSPSPVVPPRSSPYASSAASSQLSLNAAVNSLMNILKEVPEVKANLFLRRVVELMNQTLHEQIFSRRIPPLQRFHLTSQ